MSSTEQSAEFVYLIALLVLVISAFMVRRVPIGKGLKMFAGWVIIFAAAFVAFALKDDIIAFGKRVAQAGSGAPTVVQQGETLRVKQSYDGHFWVDARVNGKAVRFLIDSGATTTSISAPTAQQLGIEPSGAFPTHVQTANGVVAVQRGRAGRVEVGTIVREDLPVHISEAFGEMNVLGMNFLSSLSGWGVEGKWLILKP